MPTALIVEDELIIVLELEEILQDLGYEAVEAFSSNAAALSWLEHSLPELAIVDYRLKDGTSERLIAILGAAKVPTVVYSGRSFDPDADDQALASCEWLMKPADERMLAQAISRASMPG